MQRWHGIRNKLAGAAGVLVMLGLAACGSRVPTVGDLEARDARGADAAPADDGPRVLPWVETFAGNGACRMLSPPPVGATFPRSQVDFGVPPLAVAVDGQGRVAVVSSGVLWVVEGDVARKLARDGYDDGLATDPVVGVSTSHAVATADGLGFVVVDDERLRLVRNGEIRTLAGKKGEAAWVDGAAADARFLRLRAVARVAGGWLLGDAQRLRFFDGVTVSTLAGDGTTPEGPPDWQPAKGGPALERPIGTVFAIAPQGEGGVIRFYAYYRLWTLEDALLTVDAGYTPRSPLTQEFVDGAAGDARMGSEITGLVVRGERLLFADAGFDALRELADGTVTTLNDNGAPGKPPPRGYRDGPLAQARFDRPLGMALDAQGRLYVADFGNCRVRRITFE